MERGVSNVYVFLTFLFLFFFFFFFIQLKFDATSMLPLLECSWSKRLIEDSEDPKTTLLEYLPEGKCYWFYFRGIVTCKGLLTRNFSFLSADTSLTEEQWLEKRKEPFEIPGTLVESFKDKEDNEYNVYRVSIRHSALFLFFFCFFFFC